MGVQLYWGYHYRDTRVEAAIAADPRETHPVWGLREGQLVAGGSNVATSGMSKFIPWEHDRIRDQMIAAFLYRCWRFPDCYVVLAGGASADSTLVVRRRMLNVALSSDIRRAVAPILAEHRGSKAAAISRLRRRHLRSVAHQRQFDVRLAWEIYSHQALKDDRASILSVEDLLQEGFWCNVRHRVRCAERVKVHRIGRGTFAAGDGLCLNHEVDGTRMACTCLDFWHYGRLIGLHCKHLVAALREMGTWDRYWGDYIPAAGPTARRGTTAVIPATS